MQISCLPNVLFDPHIGLYQVLSLRIRLNLWVMAMKRCSLFLKSPRLESCHQMVYCPIQNSRWGGFYLSARRNWCILQPQLTGLSKTLFCNDLFSDHSRGWHEDSLFNSYNTEVGRALLLSLDYSTLPLIRTL